VYRVHLSEDQRQELQRRARYKTTMPRTRDRLEMVRLSDAGWSIPKIARHLSIDEQRVRHWIKAFLAGGFDALPDKAHPGQKSSLTPQILATLGEKFREGGRTWTAGQVAQWIAAEHGVRLSPIHLSRMLKRAKLSYKRTTRSLEHKQNPDEVQRKSADLQTLKKGHTPVS
jgi:putative transposase